MFKVRKLSLFSVFGSALLVCGANPNWASELPELSVSSNGRFLETAEGKPFFYLADTAWELFHRLNREEADLYLENRAAKGFSVIQAVALAELDGLTTPNAYGHFPLLDNDPLRPDVRPGPDNDYWDHVDYIVERAASLGLYVGMLPTWGDKWQGPQQPGRPIIFDATKAEAYGEWLANRYATMPIIWILGGDRNIYSEQDARLIEAMARGLKRGDGGRHLITYHPRGPGKSSDYFHDAEWLDFNMYQSSHAARDHDNGLFAEQDYGLKPAKPTLDGEPRYETIPVGFYLKTTVSSLRMDDYDVRQAAYWSVLAGACGHTYGNNNIWQMWDHGRPPVISAQTPWHQAMDHPGAFQMGYLRRLMESRPFHQLEPVSDWLKDAPLTGGAKVRSAMAKDGSFALVYSPRGESFTLDLGVLRVRKVRQVREAWYDPRYGTAHLLHTSDTAGLQTYVPPSSGRGQDWLLILDDADRGFSLPGFDR
ncbi:MAG: glycoside hydrolase family 140 protein [bacterium]|nr:glycoside hydrolase family 140 protein [bacterium]